MSDARPQKDRQSLKVSGGREESAKKMVNYWKSKVLPTIKKVFDKNGPKKAAAAETCKLFDENKEQYTKEFEDKKTELQPKVVEIYEASSTEIKTLVKEPKEADLKKHSAAVQKFLDELAKIEFPGTKSVCEAATKVGPAYLPGPVFFLFEQVSTFIVTEEKKEEAVPPAEVTPEKTAEDTGEAKEKDIVVEEPKKEEIPAAEGGGAFATTAEPPKVEEVPPPPASAAKPPKP
ncbi:Plasma membrane-associated cation-binding protein 1 [Abeliophyllum distichum]|uniref:Plasma membrane-associated cation-binding protein 1 n=1 Tax=Abeliophyllum distichum TaxID=126358 RepID=A0ABD1QEM3_9LAMI